MPRLSGVNLLGVLLAAIAMYIIGYAFGTDWCSQKPSMDGSGMFFAG